MFSLRNGNVGSGDDEAQLEHGNMRPLNPLLPSNLEARLLVGHLTFEAYEKAGILGFCLDLSNPI